ncbi:MAG TPA: lysylphosphatidylglycerol synthase transmembrane domain-containing protein, partial [Vicinamibacterales bacterium]|nr:lysylphosphatidylglycerol synthase transmembrane domain-containing protein [Vicinamibacterales bacterium]
GPVRWSTAFRTTVIGFTVIFLLPGRVGEILRPYLLARREGLNAASTFATVIVERLLDVVTVSLLFAVAVFLSGIDVGERVKFAGIVAAVGASTALAILCVLAGHPERLGRFAGRLSRRLPPKIAAAVARIVQTFTEGLVVLRSPARLAVAAVWSVAVWAVIGLSIWLTSQAFDLTLSAIGTFIVVGYLAVGVSVPTPGGVGGFEVLYKEAVTTFFGANPDVGAAAALVLHAVSFVPVTILGLVMMWREGLTLGGLKSMKAEAQAAEHPASATNTARAAATAGKPAEGAASDDGAAKAADFRKARR